MRILLDTNIIIYREASRVVRADIGTLFNWMDRLHDDKYVHPGSVREIEKHQDPNVVAAFRVKMSSYNLLKTLAPETDQITNIRKKYDVTLNDEVDTDLLRELVGKRVDLLITEDKKIHQKARELGLSTSVFTIEMFLEKVTAENPDLADYRVLAVKKELFGNLNIDDPFFDSFREDYPGFNAWFNRKADETAYVSINDEGSVVAFLYLKPEGVNESYRDIEPVLSPKRRMKIGTFKVISVGFKMGERFLKVVFDNALRFRVDEVYVTIFNRTDDQIRLIGLLSDFGFILHGIKHSQAGDENVYTRDFTRTANIQQPNLTYPFISRKRNKFIVPIYPEYHTELLPDSILKTESPKDYDENRSYRNAISKVYISRSIERNLEPGDIIVFYRTKDEGKGYYTSVATTIGVVQSVKKSIASKDEFIQNARKRSVFSDSQLEEQWDYKPSYRPFIVNFLYVYSLPAKLNLKRLLELGIISKAPRGFERLTDAAFQTLLREANADTSFIVD